MGYGYICIGFAMPECPNLCVCHSGICSIISSPSAKAVLFVAAWVKTTILNGDGKLVGKESLGDW